MGEITEFLAYCCGRDIADIDSGGLKYILSYYKSTMVSIIELGYSITNVDYSSELLLVLEKEYDRISLCKKRRYWYYIRKLRWYRSKIKHLRNILNMGGDSNEAGRIW